MPSYSPPWAPHVVGTYPDRKFDPETQEWSDQKIEMKCTTCGGTYQFTCTSGAVRQHIQNFAVAHAHRDPFRQRIPG